MEYEISLEDRVWEGFVFRVNGEPSWFDRLCFRSRISDSYIMLPHGLDSVYVQKKHTPEVLLVRELDDGLWVMDDYDEPWYRASPLFTLLFNSAMTEYKKMLKEYQKEKA